jgi:CRISPR-associated protein Csm3
VILAGILRTQTGLHIGTERGAPEIGGLDLPVVRDPITQEPYVPASTLRKVRALLERTDPRAGTDPKWFNRKIGKEVFIHACDTAEKAVTCWICRLFGSSAGEGNAGSNFPTRLIIRDARLTTYSRDALMDAADRLYARFTERKSETVLDRITAAANPRQLERVPAGTDFSFEMIYNVEMPEDTSKDLETLAIGLKLLEDDTLGGHGSRGSGKVEFFVTRFLAKPVAAYRPDGADMVKALVNLDIVAVDKGDIDPRANGKSLDVLRGMIPEVASHFLSGGK